MGSKLCYQVDPTVWASLPLLTAWTDSPLGNQVLRETMHPAYYTSKYGHPFGDGEADYDFFQRIAGSYNAAPGAKTWQSIAYRIGWSGGPYGNSPDTWIRYVADAKWYLLQHYRALVLSEFFSQPAVVAAYGRVNWPVNMGVSEAMLQYEKDYVQSVFHNEARKDGDIGIMGYVTLAVMSFGIGLAVSTAVAAIAAEVAAAAAAEVATGIAAEGVVTLGVEAGLEGAVAVEAISVGAETFITETAIVSDALTTIATDMAAKVATQEIMSLITTGDFADLDPVKLALSAGGQIVSAVDLGSIAEFDASFPDVAIADVIPLVGAGWSIYDAFFAVDADPTIAQRTAPPPPPAKTSAPAGVAPILTAMPGAAGQPVTLAAPAFSDVGALNYSPIGPPSMYEGLLPAAVTGSAQITEPAQAGFPWWLLLAVPATMLVKKRYTGSRKGRKRK